MKGNTSKLNRKPCLNLEVLLQELVITDNQKLFDILEVYSRNVTMAEARVVFEVINSEDYPESFFMPKPSVATIIGYANNNGVEIKWKGKEGNAVYLKDCYFDEQFPEYV